MFYAIGSKAVLKAQFTETKKSNKNLPRFDITNN